MRKGIRVLVVEDSPMGAETIIRAIKNGSDQVDISVVDSRDSFVSALDAGQWDALICDYLLKDFTGRDALQLYRARGLDIPFICVSGEIGGEEAATIIRDGAHDFVSKSHLWRLRPVLERELEAAEARRHRQQVAEHSTRLAAIVEGTDDAVFSRDMAGTVLTWNAAAERMYGYTVEEAVGRPVSFIVPPDRTQELVDILGMLKSGRRIERMETTRVRKDGGTLRVSMTISPLRNERGEIIGASVIARDITRRWMLELERETLIKELQEALSKVKMLSGLLPICSSCKKIRNEQGKWQQVEVYVHEHSQADFTHGICPECAQQLYPGLEKKREQSKSH